MASSSSISQNPGNPSSAIDVSTSNYGYDVFISCHSDLEKTLASHLYHRLISNGLRVFLGIPEMQKDWNISNRIEEAIRTASLHVAIFSFRYAESVRCLRELDLMTKLGTPIIPVYCYVSPVDLRRTSWSDNGFYAKALKFLETKLIRIGKPKDESDTPRYSERDIKQWKKALSTVADKSGFDINEFNGDQVELLDNVVGSVLEGVWKAALIITTHQTDPQLSRIILTERIEEFEKYLRKQVEKRHIVGIVGFAGVGKTALAKVLFKMKKSSFSRSFFLSSIRVKARKKSVHFLQRELCKGLINVDIQAGSVNQGMEVFEENVSSIYGSSALVILDDVDQLDKLLPPKNYSPSKKFLILITSRSREVLTRFGIEDSSIYTLPGLNWRYSKDIFCFKAFNDGDPPSVFEPVVEKFVQSFQGLPLCLEVYGALVSGENNISDLEDKLEILLDLDLNQRLPEWDHEQLARLPRDIEKFKDLSGKAKAVIKIALLQRQSEKVQVVGIVGFDGVGKTFLAKELFEKKKSSYGKSCFLYDVSSSSLHTLLRKLLKVLTQLDLQVESVEECRDLFEKQVKFPSLVILDNVSHQDQLDAILSVLTVLPSSSLILITSSGRDVLKSSGVQESSIYELNVLNTEDSLKLFCTYAFGQPIPPQRFQNLVAEFLTACNGLPLTLKVFGGLCGKTKRRSGWKDHLHKLRKSSNDIRKNLKISYDALSAEHQHMFLHIACCCIGEKRELAVKLWDRTGSKGLSGFNSLKERCLVEVDSEDCIFMHEHLRDLGVSIAQEKRLRNSLWPPTENNPDLLQQSSNEQVITELRRNIDDLMQLSSEVRRFMIMILIMIMAMMVWSMGLNIILTAMIMAIVIWSMKQ